jgi:DNA-binding transcriptional regulator YiaG
MLTRAKKQSAREAREKMTGEKMQEISEDLGLTQADVALLLGGYHQSTVSIWYKTGNAPEIVKHIFASPTCRKHFFQDKALISSELK